jgi:intracellular sulfur oxidation DsrE/DsrF family protein
MQTRKDFLAAGAVAALLPVAANAAAPAPSASPAAHEKTDFVFDLAAFDAATSRPAQHRNAFASTKIDDGTVLRAVENTLDAYESVKVPLSSVLPAVVLYHGSSIAMAFDDAIWKEYLIPSIPKAPEDLRADIAGYAKATGNPFPQVGKLVSKGTLFFVCNNATLGFATFIGRLRGEETDAVYARLAGGLLPGASLVPAGVWAVHALQERRFTYLQTTL